MCHFLKLFMVRIFPTTTDQAKKAILKGTLVHQILFHGKQNALITNKDVKAFWPMLRKCRGRFICLAREFFRGAGCLWVVRVGVAVEAPLELSFYAGKG